MNTITRRHLIKTSYGTRPFFRCQERFLPSMRIVVRIATWPYGVLPRGRCFRMFWPISPAVIQDPLVLKLTCVGTPSEGNWIPVGYSRNLAARFREADSGKPFGEAGSTTMARLLCASTRLRPPPLVAPHDTGKRAQSLVSFPCVREDGSHIRIKGDDDAPLGVTRRVLVGPRPSEVVFGQDLVWCHPTRASSLTTQRGIMATPIPALLRSRGRPSPLQRARRKGSALPTDPTERGGPPPLLGLSPGLCGPGGLSPSIRTAQ
jgi:hypothetical protein